MNTVYKETVAYAKSHDELNKWRESYQTNIRCKEAIETDIRDNYSDNCLKTNGSAVIKEFGVERVAWVLAATIRYKDWDGRFSPKNKEWAKTVFPDNVLEDRRHIGEICPNSHSVLLNGYTDSIKEAMERGKDNREQER